MGLRAIAWVLEDSNLGPTDRFVAAVIAYHSDEAGENAFPSLTTLSKLTGYDRRTVARSVGRLRELGAIEQTAARGGGTRVYRLPMGSARGTAPLEAERLEAERPQGQSAPGVGAERPFARGTAPPDPPLTGIDPPNNIREIFDYWRSTFGKNGSTKLTPERRDKIKARLKQGYTVDQIKRAIDGCAGSGYHVEHGHTDLTLICRNGSKLEGFIGRPAKKEAPTRERRYTNPEIRAT